MTFPGTALDLVHGEAEYQELLHTCGDNTSSMLKNAVRTNETCQIQPDVRPHNTHLEPLKIDNFSLCAERCVCKLSLLMLHYYRCYKQSRQL